MLRKKLRDPSLQERPKEYTRGKCRDSPNTLTQDDTQPVEGMKSLCSQTRNIETRDVTYAGRLVSSTEGMYMLPLFHPEGWQWILLINSLVVCATQISLTFTFISGSPLPAPRSSSLVSFKSVSRTQWDMWNCATRQKLGRLSG